MGSRERFVSTPDENVAGTSGQGHFEASFVALKRVLGEPVTPNGDGKVSTRWVIRDTETDDVWTIFDYKETVLWDPARLTVEEFRAKPTYNWNIGGYHKKRDDFITWLRQKIAAAPVNDNEEFTDEALAAAEQEGEAKHKAMMTERREALVARIRRLGTFTDKDVPEVLLENERKLIAISILEVDAKDIVPAMKEALG